MFSIVIPSKNEETDIGALLQSIRDQTLRPKELIVVDKSTDRTREIARSFGATVIEGQDDGRVGRARNKGADNTSSEYIVFLDADVELPTVTFIEDALTCFEALNSDIASCYFRPFHANYKGRIIFAFMNFFKRLDSIFRTGIASGGAFILIKRDVFEKAGKFDDDMKISEDQELFRRTIKKGFRYDTLPVWINVSSRRFSEASVPSILVSILGGVGTLAANPFGLSWFKKRLKIFERWYGETGGQSDNPEQ